MFIAGLRGGGELGPEKNAGSESLMDASAE